MFTNIHITTQELTKEAAHLTPQEFQDSLSSQLLEKNNFLVEVKKSTIPLAGKGLFIHGSVVHPGTVIALFPGKVHLPQYLTNEYVDSELLPDADFYLMGRYLY